MQNKKLYVGNMNYSTTNDQVKELFSNYGTVDQVNVIEGKGFGFVEMSTPEDAEKAKEALNGSEFDGRTIKVDIARPMRPRGDNRGGGFKKRDFGGHGFKKDGFGGDRPRRSY